MEKGKKLQGKTPEDVARMLEEDDPLMIRKVIFKDFVHALIDCTQSRDRVNFGRLVDSFIEYATKAQAAEQPNGDFRAIAHDMVWGLCESLDRQGYSATAMFREYKPRHYLN